MKIIRIDLIMDDPNKSINKALAGILELASKSCLKLSYCNIEDIEEAEIDKNTPRL